MGLVPLGRLVAWLGAGQQPIETVTERIRRVAFSQAWRGLCTLLVGTIVSGRSIERGALVVEQIRSAGGQADFVGASLDGSPKASRGLATEARRVLGRRIDVLVNSAGIFPRSTTATTDEATFDEVYAVNVKAPYF